MQYLAVHTGVITLDVQEGGHKGPQQEAGLAGWRAEVREGVAYTRQGGSHSAQIFGSVTGEVRAFQEDVFSSGVCRARQYSSSSWMS